MVKDIQLTSEDYDRIFNKILAYLRRTEPKGEKESLVKIAHWRTETWTNFISDNTRLVPLLELFKEVGELSNLKIERVNVEYPSEPFLIIDYNYKETKRESRLTYEEAKRELEFARPNNIIGVEKLMNTMERLEMVMIDTRKVRKVGNSLVVTIPESISNLFSLEDGDYLSFIYRFGEVRVKRASSEIQ